MREVPGIITKVGYEKSEYYDYDKKIIFIEVRNERSGWYACLMFEQKQKDEILNQFNVQKFEDLVGKNCTLLEYRKQPNKVPIAIKANPNYQYYIEAKNEYFKWK